MSPLSTDPPQLLPLFNATPESIAASTKRLQAGHAALLDRIAAEIVPETATFDSVLRPILLFEDSCGQEKWGNFWYQNVATDKAMREASRESIVSFDEYEIECGVREDIFNLVEAAHDTRHSQNLDAESLRLLETEHRKYVDKGMLLSASERLKFIGIRKRISQLCSEACGRLTEASSGLWLAPEDLQGIPPDEIDITSLEKGTGENEGKVKVTFSADFAVSIVRYAEKESTRRACSIGWDNMVNENAPLFKEVIVLRDEAARMIGYKNHATMRIAEKMAKTPERVDELLQDVATRAKDGAEKDVAQLLKQKKEFCEDRGLDFDGNLFMWDRSFFHQRRKSSEFGVDNKEVAKYFPVDQTLQRMLEIFAKLLGLVFIPLSTEDRARLSPTGKAKDVAWHDDVEIYAVWDNAALGGGFCGYLYMDLFPRDGKYKGDMTLTIGPGCEKGDGTRHYASAALVCNLGRKTPNAPALMKHDDVETIFHELGHAMDTLSYRGRYERSCDLQQDAIEIPSLMLEYWCWDARVLKTMSGHYETGEAIPDELVRKLAATKNLHIAQARRASLYPMMFDMKVHGFASHEEAEALDCAVLYNQLRKEFSGTRGPEDLGMGLQWGHGYLTWDHLLAGYDAGHYSYLWSAVMAADMFYTVFNEDPMSEVQGQRYRRLLIEKGNSRDALDSLTEFLGRAPNAEAFQREELVSV